jgi:Acetoacetate decarboxylase (ADC)
MPRFGTLQVRDWASRIPEVDGYTTAPIVLKGATVMNLASEIASLAGDPLVPAAMNPSIPPYVQCTVSIFPETPFGPIKMAELRVVARAAYRPRAFVLRSFIDNAEAAREMARRWGYPAAAGTVEMRERHDRVEAMAYCGGRLILHGEMRHREIVAGVDLQFISSMHLVRNRADGKVVLMQVDPEYAVARAERGDSHIISLDPDAWHTGECLLLTNPMTATLAYCDVTLPRIRYVCDPDRPAYEGTVRVAARVQE